MINTNLLCFVIVLVLTLINCERYKTTIYTTKYGSLFGTRAPPETDFLKPAFVIRGIEYGSTRSDKLRFLPPSGSLEKWKGIQKFFRYRSVCPQMFFRDRSYVHFFDHLSYIPRQGENCLSMNIFVLVQGRIYIHLCTNLQFNHCIRVVI